MLEFIRKRKSVLCVVGSFCSQFWKVEQRKRAQRNVDMNYSVKDFLKKNLPIQDYISGSVELWANQTPVISVVKQVLLVNISSGLIKVVNIKKIFQIGYGFAYHVIINLTTFIKRYGILEEKITGSYHIQAV